MFFFFILDIFFAFRHIGETFVEPKILPGGTGVVRHPGFRENPGDGQQPQPVSLPEAFGGNRRL